MHRTGRSAYCIQGGVLCRSNQVFSWAFSSRIHRLVSVRCPQQHTPSFILVPACCFVLLLLGPLCFPVSSSAVRCSVLTCPAFLSPDAWRQEERSVVPSFPKPKPLQGSSWPSVACRIQSGRKWKPAVRFVPTSRSRSVEPTKIKPSFPGRGPVAGLLSLVVPAFSSVCRVIHHARITLHSRVVSAISVSCRFFTRLQTDAECFPELRSPFFSVPESPGGPAKQTSFTSSPRHRPYSCWTGHPSCPGKRHGTSLSRARCGGGGPLQQQCLFLIGPRRSKAGNVEEKQGLGRLPFTAALHPRYSAENRQHAHFWTKRAELSRASYQLDFISDQCCLCLCC